MAADFNWWLLIVGVVAGGVLTWLVLADSARDERDIGDEELRAEAGWISRAIDVPGVDAAAAEAVLHAHRRYLSFPPPDVLVSPDELDGGEATARGDARATAAVGSATARPGDATDDRAG